MIPDASQLESGSFENTDLGKRVQDRINEAENAGVRQTFVGTASSDEEEIDLMIRYLESKGYDLMDLGASYKIEWKEKI